MTNEEFSKRLEAGYESVDLGGELGSVIPLSFVEINDEGDPRLWVWGLGSVAAPKRFHGTEIYWSIKDDLIWVLAQGDDAYSLQKVIDFAPLKNPRRSAPAKRPDGAGRFADVIDPVDAQQYTAYRPVERTRT